MWRAVHICRRRDRPPVWRPCWRAAQLERVGDDPGIRTVGVDDVQQCFPVLVGREGEPASVRRYLRASDDSCFRRAPHFRGRSIGKLPDCVAAALRGHVEEVVRTETRRESAARRQRNRRRRGRPDGCVRDAQPPQRSFRRGKRRYEALTVCVPASEVYRSRAAPTRCGTRRSTSMACSHGPEPSLSLARYMSVRRFNRTGWLTRALWYVMRSAGPPVDLMRQDVHAVWKCALDDEDEGAVLRPQRKWA